MPTACVQTPGSRIVLESERLVVFIPDEEGGTISQTRRDIPLRDLDRMVMGEGIGATMPAMMEMLRRGIPISFLDGLGRFLGSFQPAAPHHGAARLRQYQRTLEGEFNLVIARELLSAKIYNQKRVIQRVAANRRAEGINVSGCVSEAVESLDRALGLVGAAVSIESLRGHEGLAAARYFAAWSSFLPSAFPFVRRSTRPPLNPVNAVLSFGASLIYQECHSFLHSHGLDASLGTLHATENGRWSLALDLMEPFRPVVSESLALDLFSHRMLNESHFEPHEGGIWLNRDGRSKLILQYEKRMERQFLSESAGHRTTLRQQLENHAISFKKALDSQDSFNAFRMN